MPQIIVDRIATIDAPSNGPYEDGDGSHAKQWTVHFEGKQSARLDLSFKNAAAYVDILDDLRRQSIPVSVEVADDGAITQVFLPHIALVTGLKHLPSGDVAVRLEPSHGGHTLRVSNSKFAELLMALNAAYSSKTVVAVTETPDGHDVFDVRAAPDPFDAAVAEYAESPLCEEIIAELTPLDVDNATNLFEKMAARSCDPLAPDSTCIPFRYPDDGCEARAHEMCRAMSEQGIITGQEGVIAGKVWLYAEPASFRYFVSTVNSPCCRVPWGYHVAPVVRIGAHDLRVIDPSLFIGPVTVDRWKNRQFPDGTLTLTRSSVYDQPKPGRLQFDPEFVTMNKVLRKWRSALKIRSLEKGPPPYDQC